MFRVVFKFRGVGAGHPEHIATEFDGGDLEPEADAQVGHVLGAGVMSGEDFSFDAAIAKAARNEHPVSRSEKGPRRGVFLCIPTFLKMAGFNPVDDELSVNRHRRMLEALDDREVSVRKVGVFAHHGDVHFFGERVEMVRHGFPVLKQRRGRAINIQNVAQPLFLQH